MPRVQDHAIDGVVYVYKYCPQCNSPREVINGVDYGFTCGSHFGDTFVITEECDKRRKELPF